MLLTAEVEYVLSVTTRLQATTTTMLLLLFSDNYYTANNQYQTQMIIIYPWRYLLSSTAPAICESSLWVLWANVGQRQMAAISQAMLQTWPFFVRL